MKKFSTHPSWGRVRMLLLIALMALAAGCSTVRFSYHHGDTLLYWWLNSYVDFDNEQSNWVKREIDGFFRWHQSTQLRDYAAMLSKWQRQLAGNPSQADLLADYREIKSKAEAMAFRAAPQMADLAHSITPGQIANIERKFSKNNEDYRKKFVSADLERQHKLRYEKSMDQLQLWFGPFSHDQKAILRKASDARPLVYDVLQQERKLRQQKVLALLRRVQQEKLNKEQTTAAVTAMLREFFDRDQSPERKQFFDAYSDDTTKFVLTAIRLATPEQKAHAQERMQGWINDFNALAAGN
jgi:Family of unknown function (DUF6279)